MITENQNVLLVEDLTTDGGSKLSFVEAIRETGANCSHTAVIFYYGIFPGTEETLVKKTSLYIVYALGGTCLKKLKKMKTLTPKHYLRLNGS